MRPLGRRLAATASAVLLGHLAALPACAQGTAPAADPAIRVAVDPRIELVSIIFRLAGNPEYSRGRVPSYIADIDRHFAPVANHAAVQRARALRASRGVSFDAPMSLAVYLPDPLADGTTAGVALDPLPLGVDGRWSSREAVAFAADARAFARDGHFATFYKAHAALYRTAVDRMRETLLQAGVKEWFDSFFGSRSGAAFTVALGLVNGGSNYGASTRANGGKQELYAIIGAWEVDGSGMPTFGAGVLGTVVHEFCHSYANPLVSRHIAELRSAGESIFPQVEASMRRQAYGSWQTMMYESLVRGCVIRYSAAHGGSVEREVEQEKAGGFLWMGELVGLLAEYEKARERYPTLEAFFPRIARLFSDCAGRIGTMVRDADAERQKRADALRARGPKIAQVSPRSGAGDVDPGLTSIVVTFDRPMVTGNMAVMRLDDAEFPPMTGKAKFDSSGRSLTLPVRLRSGTAYGFGLNRDGFLVMRDTQGNPLAPVEVRFRTR